MDAANVTLYNGAFIKPVMSWARMEKMKIKMKLNTALHLSALTARFLARQHIYTPNCTNKKLRQLTQTFRRAVANAEAVTPPCVAASPSHHRHRSWTQAAHQEINNISKQKTKQKKQRRKKQHLKRMATYKAEWKCFNTDRSFFVLFLPKQHLCDTDTIFLLPWKHIATKLNWRRGFTGKSTGCNDFFFCPPVSFNQDQV